MVVPPSAKLRSNRPVPLASLAGKPMILPSPPHGIRTLVDHACAVSRVELTIAAETNAMRVQRSLVIGGHGLTILRLPFADDVQRKLVSAAPLSDPKITRTIVLALPGNRAVGQHVQRVEDLLVACARDAAQHGAWVEGRWLGA